MSINQDLKDTNLDSRTSLIIYLKSVSDQYKLRKYGDIVYFSKKMKYCILYVDSQRAPESKKEITALDFVKKVENSEQDELDLSGDHLEGQITEMARQAELKLQKRQEKNEDLLK